MCNLCGTPEEQKLGQDEEKYRAEQLERMAAYCRQLSKGTLKPHTDAMKPVTSLAYAIIRSLVEDFV